MGKRPEPVPPVRSRLDLIGDFLTRPFLGFLVAAVAATQLLASPSNTAPGADRRSSEIGQPLEVLIDLPKELAPGSSTTLAGRVVMHTPAPQLVLRFEAEGAALVSSESLVLGTQGAGTTVPFQVGVAFTGTGRAAVRIRAEVSDDTGRSIFFVRETLYALLRADRSFVGTGDFMQLDLQAIEHDAQAKALSSADAAEQRRKLVQMQPTPDNRPMTYVPPSTADERNNVAVGAPAEGYRPADPKSGGGSLLGDGTITVQGQAQWQDENGAFHPVWGATIEIRDDDTLGDEVVAVLVTDTNGNYSATIDNDDGFLQGDRDIYVRYRTANSWVDCQNTSGDTYETDSATHPETPDGTVITENFFFSSGGNNDSNSVFQAGTRIAGYIANDVEAAALPQVALTWPNGGSGSFYDGKVQIEQDDRWDWDTVHHEYGHYVMDELNIDDNPGGAHNIGDCAAQVRASKDEGNRLAWGEGWPTYFGTSGQAEFNMAALGVPRVGDTSYQDLEDGSVVYSLESQDSNGRGEDNEVAVQRLLWDLYDGNNDGRDTVSRSDNDIWNAIKGAAGAPHLLSTYWTALRAGQSSSVDLLMGEIASDHQIGPRQVAPADGAVISPSNRQLSWQADVGCPSSYGGDSFDLRFFNQASLAPLLTIPGINTTSYELSLAELATLAGATHNVVWAVEGRNGMAPATGPYLGENRAVIVNRPPEANAGPDIVAECTGQAGTPVMMDGSGSTDPDGDPLTYVWSAPGVSFNPPNSPTPTGDFPLGTTPVTLTVSDGIDDDSDSMAVTVQDTTPPIVSIQQPTSSQFLTPTSLPFHVVFSVDEKCGVARELILLDGCPIYDGNTFGDGDGLLRDEVLTIDEAALCRIVNICGRRRWDRPTFTVRVTDAGGNVGADTHVQPNGYMVVPSKCQ